MESLSVPLMKVILKNNAHQTVSTHNPAQNMFHVYLFLDLHDLLNMHVRKLKVTFHIIRILFQLACIPTCTQWSKSCIHGAWMLNAYSMVTVVIIGYHTIVNRRYTLMIEYYTVSINHTCWLCKFIKALDPSHYIKF